MKRIIIVAVLAGLALAGCGGSTTTTTIVQPPPTTPTTTTTVTTTAHTVTSREHTTTIVTPPTATTTTYAPSGGYCGSGIAVNSTTSCPFAQNVKSAYYNQLGSGSGTVIAYSPATGKTYAMSCIADGGGVTCTGGNNAYVSW